MKFSLIIFFFLVSCSSQLTTLNQKKLYSAKGFAYIYNENDFNQKIIKGKMNNEIMQISHQYLKTGTLAENINRLRDAEKRAAYAERQKAAQREKYGDATDKSRGYDNTSARQTKPQPMGAGFFFMCLLLGLFLLLFIMAAIYL